MIGYCLTLMDVPSIWRLSAVLHARLEGHERVFLAFSILSSLTDDEYAAVIKRMSEDAG